MGSDDDQRKDEPGTAEKKRPDDSGPWAKTSSGDADSVIHDGDEEKD